MASSTSEKTEPTKKLTPAERAILERTGACLACSCEAFERSEHRDGFAHCTCHHTVWGHAKTSTVPEATE